MLGVSAYKYDRRSYSTTLYPTSFTLDSLLALRTCAQHKTHGLCFTPDRMTNAEFFVSLYVLEREGRRTYTGVPTGGDSNH